MSEKLTAQEIVDAAQRDVNTTGGVMLDVCNEWKNENAQLREQVARLKEQRDRLAGAAHILHCHSFGGMVSDEELSDAREVALKYGKTAQQITEGK